MITLFPWQEESAAKLTSLLTKGTVALDGSETGTGKTYVALDVAKRLQAKPLVITPKSAVSSFAAVADDMGVPLLDVLNLERLKTGRTPYLKRTVGPMVRKGRKMVKSVKFEWLMPPGSLVLWDEAHRAGGLDSENSKIMALMKAYGLKVLMMSATIADSPLRLRTAGYLLGLHDYRPDSFYGWCRSHGCVFNVRDEDDRYGFNGWTFTKSEAESQKYMLQIHRELEPYMVRLLIKNIPGFPECEFYPKLYDLEGAAEVNREMYKNPKLATNPLAVLSIERQQTELLKVPVLLELAREAVENENKSVVIFTCFREPLRRLADGLRDLSVVQIHGDQTELQRFHSIQEFQADRARVCVATIGAGGVSVSLHDLNGKYPRIAYIMPPLSTVEFKQAIGRIWRAGAKSKAQEQLVLAAGTVEDHVFRLIKRKLKNLDTLNDGDLSGGLLG